MDTLDISFFIELARQENGVRKGYDPKTGLWIPHGSVEGGNRTIAYGHKLTKKEEESGVFDDGIDTYDAIDLLVNDFNKAWEIAQDNWDDKFPERFATLARKYKYVLAELVFNTGPLIRNGNFRWPKLAQAIRNGNDQAVYENGQRYYTDPKSKNKIRLTNRVRELYRALGMSFTPFVDK